VQALDSQSPFMTQDTAGESLFQGLRGVRFVLSNYLQEELEYRTLRMAPFSYFTIASAIMHVKGFGSRATTAAVLGL